MRERLSRFGVGPKIAASVVACAAAASALTYAFPEACLVPALQNTAIMTLALVLMVMGIPMWLVGAIEVMRAYNRDQLVTTGVFGLVRHPMYAAWVVLILPGIALLVGSWPFLLMPLVGYAAFMALIHTEDKYLHNRFGKSYLDYRSRVNEIIPMPRLHHRAAAARR